MEWDVKIRKELTFSYLEVKIAFIGNDLLAVIQGGDKPHIGCTVQAIPRPSLMDDGTISTTSSVLNIVGHKDEMLCRTLAEELCKMMNAVVVCTGGFHVNGIQKEQIKEVVLALDEVIQEIKKQVS